VPPRKIAARKASPARSKAARRKAASATRSLSEENDRAIARAKKTLEAAQKDLSAIRGSVGSGGRDLRKDVAKLLRDAGRDLEKMNTAVRRDLERLQKDLVAEARRSTPYRTRRTKPKPAPKPKADPPPSPFPTRPIRERRRK